MKKIIRTNNKNLDFNKLIVELDAYLKVTDGEDHEFYNQFNGLGNIKNVVIAYQDNKAAGCGAFKKFDDKTVEIKRMYVNPKFRGKKLGNLLIEEVIEISKGNEFSKLYLDTAHFMSSAISLYKKYGFKETTAYPESVLPKDLLNSMIFMMKEL